VKRREQKQLRFADTSFDQVLTVNTIYYCLDMRGACREIAKALKLGGRVAIGFRSPATLWLATAT
jgi:hypothetical protein